MKTCDTCALLQDAKPEHEAYYICTWHFSEPLPSNALTWHTYRLKDALSSDSDRWIPKEMIAGKAKKYLKECPAHKPK